MEILLIGSAGNIGSAVYRELSESHSVTGVDLNESETTDIVGSIRECEGLDPEAVINLAGSKGNNIDPLVKTQVNLVLEICDRFPHSKIIHASSAAVYKSSPESISEKDTKAPRNTYGRAKLLSEDIVRQKADNYVILRIFNPYGLNPEASSVVPIFIRKAIRDEDIVIKESENSSRDFIHKEDLCRAVEKSLNIENKTLNLGSGQKTTLINLANTITEATDSDSEIRIEGDNQTSFVSDNSKIEDLLNFQPEISTEEGIKEFLTEFDS